MTRSDRVVRRVPQSRAVTTRYRVMVGLVRSTNTIAVGDDPIGLAISPTGAEAGDIYVTNGVSNSVSVIEP